MIPSIKNILEMLLDGVIDKHQALMWIDDHIEMTAADKTAELRDHFAGLAMQGLSACEEHDMNHEDAAVWAYRRADAMMKARAE